MKSEAFRDDVASRVAMWRENYERQTAAARAERATWMLGHFDTFAGIQGDSVTASCTPAWAPIAPITVDGTVAPWAVSEKRVGRTVTLTVSVGGAAPAADEGPKLRMMDAVPLTGDATHWPLRPAAADRYAALSDYGAFVDYERLSDRPGIAAMAAKTAQPAPEPVVSILGQQVAESELQAALNLIRQKNAPPAEKETPRGLLCVRDFDHRLGAWGR